MLESYFTNLVGIREIRYKHMIKNIYFYLFSNIEPTFNEVCRFIKNKTKSQYRSDFKLFCMSVYNYENFFVYYRFPISLIIDFFFNMYIAQHKVACN